MDVNLIITCEHTECNYCHEKQCGKPAIYINDADCVALNNTELHTNTE